MGKWNETHTQLELICHWVCSMDLNSLLFLETVHIITYNSHQKMFLSKNIQMSVLCALTQPPPLKKHTHQHNCDLSDLFFSDELFLKDDMSHRLLREQKQVVRAHGSCTCWATASLMGAVYCVEPN